MEIGVKENYHIFVSKGQSNGGNSLRRDIRSRLGGQWRLEFKEKNK